MRRNFKFWRNKSGRVYLGAAQVLPLSKLAATWELRPAFGPNDEELQRKFESWLDIPRFDEAESLNDNDIVVDVYLKEFRSGQDIQGNVGDIPIMLFWRPRVQVAGIVSAAKTSKVISRIDTTYKMPWRMFLRMALTPRAIFFGVSAAGIQYADFLVGGALLELFGEIRNQV